MGDNLVIFSWYNGTVGIFIDGASDDGPSPVAPRRMVPHTAPCTRPLVHPLWYHFIFQGKPFLPVSDPAGLSDQVDSSVDGSRAAFLIFSLNPVSIPSESTASPWRDTSGTSRSTNAISDPFPAAWLQVGNNQSDKTCLHSARKRCRPLRIFRHFLIAPAVPKKRFLIGVGNLHAKRFRLQNILLPWIAL